jgi:adenylate cyclase
LIVGFGIGLAASAVVIGADLFFTRTARSSGIHPFRAAELKTFDWRLGRTAHPETARRDIALVEIDEYSIRNLQPNAGRWPWPRVVHSSLIDFLARAPAKVVVYDVNFADPDTSVGFRLGDSTWTGAESDRAFADSVRKAGNVIALADATFEGDAADAPAAPDPGYRLDRAAIPERNVVFPPYPVLAAAASALGHNLFVLDSDGPIRHTIPFVRARGRAFPSLGVAAALRVLGFGPDRVSIDGATLSIGDRRMPLGTRQVRTSDGAATYLWALIDFRGPALLGDLKHRPYPTYSFFDLLYSEEQLLAGVKPNVDPAVFRDKIVFVGVTASGLFDVFETPFAGGKMPGIQIHASVADDILSNRFMRANGDAARLAVMIGGSLLVGVASAVMPAWWAVGATLALISLFGFVATRLFATGYWLDFIQPVVASALAVFGGAMYQYVIEGREKRKLKRLFGRYVSRDVFAQLIADPSLARLGGHRREMTVLFSDIRGFTTVSERGRPEEIVGTLNEYFTRMTDIVFAHKGTLDKFVGDMVMALFGAPLDDPDHAEHAVQTALEMIEELKGLNAKWAAEGRPVLDIGIGINTGPMIAGNIGSEAIMSYTVIGDAVNLGSRLESLNKQYGTRLIISASTHERLRGDYLVRPLGDVVVKGKTQTVAIFEVVGRVGGVGDDRPAADAGEIADTDRGAPIG